MQSNDEHREAAENPAAGEEVRPACTPLGPAIAASLAHRGLTKKELLRRARMKEATLRGYEKGERLPPAPQLARLGAALGERPERLLGLARLLGAVESLPPERPLAPAIEALALWGNLGESVERAAEALVQGSIAPIPPIAPVSPLDLAAERSRAAELVRCLAELPVSDQARFIERVRAFRGAAVLSHLGAESEATAADSARKAEHWAGLAVLAARLTPGPETERRRLLAHAHLYQANAVRVRSGLEEAEDLASRALGLHAQSTPVPGLDDARFWDLLASLRRGQRRLGESLELLDRALAIAEPASMGRLWLKRSATLLEMGRNEESIEDLRRAVDAINPEADPRLAWAVRFNLVVNLCALDRAAEGEPWLPELGELARRLDNDLDSLRFRWLEGKVGAGLGRREEAIATLTRVRDEFLARGIVYDAALASLELAVILLEEGRTAEVKEVVRPLPPLFGALKIDREALASLKVFCAAAETEAVTLAEARRVRDVLQRGGSAPGPATA